MEGWLLGLLQALSLPEYGLLTLFVVALVSATLVPMGSEFAVIGLLKLNSELFWPAMVVATAGNTIGGGINWWLGYGIKQAYEHFRHSPDNVRALAWLQRLGPRACFLPFCRRLATRLPRSPVGSS